jgi:transaldolase
VYLPMMERNQWPQAFGQSLWLDNITRELLDGGTLQHYINAWSISGLTSNPTIFDAAIAGSTAYDESIREGARGGQSDEALFMELALDDLRRAADWNAWH